VPQRIVPVAADRRLDRSSPRTWATLHEREVLALERTGADERLQLLVGLLALRDDEQPRRVAVEPVDDPSALLHAPGGDADQTMNERAARVARGRVHDDAGRLVDDEQVLVLPGDAQRHRLVALDRCGACGRLERDLLPALEPPRLRAALPVDEHAGRDHALRRRARAYVVGDEAVETRAGRVVRDADGAHGPQGRAPRAGSRLRRR
jgi:hypothetical protein